MKTQKVILEINDGIVSAVEVPENIEIEVRDYDCLGCNQSTLKEDEYGNEYYPIYF